MRWLVVAAAVISLAACTEDEDTGGFSPYGGTRQDAALPGRQPDLRFSRPPPRDRGAPSDATADAARDAQVDAARVVDAVVVDASPPDAMVPSCMTSACTLAVVLGRCDPCPVALPRSYVEATDCVVPYDPSSPLFEYLPRSCTEACPQESNQVCLSAIGQAVCRGDGICVVVQ